MARSADGTPEYIVGTLKDVTERKNMEQALAESEAERALRLIRQVAESWLQDSDSPCLLFDAALTPLVLPKQLSEALRPYFPEETYTMLPETVLAWLQTCAQDLDREDAWTFNHESAHGTVRAFASILRMDKVPPCLLVGFQLEERDLRFALLSKVGLSKREVDVLEHLPLGLTNAQIAASLSLKEVTVRKHLKSLALKLEAKGKTETLFRAIELLRQLRMDQRGVSGPLSQMQ